MGLQYLVQMSLLWRIWTHWYKLCKTSPKEEDTTVRCYTHKKLGHIAKNCMNIGRIEDEKKARANNIGKQMRQ